MHGDIRAQTGCKNTFWTRDGEWAKRQKKGGRSELRIETGLWSSFLLGSVLQGPCHQPQMSLERSQSRVLLPHLPEKECLSQHTVGQQCPGSGPRHSQRFLGTPEGDRLAVKGFQAPRSREDKSRKEAS